MSSAGSSSAGSSSAGSSSAGAFERRIERRPAINLGGAGGAHRGAPMGGEGGAPAWSTLALPIRTSSSR